MKKLAFVLVVVLFVFSSCSSDDSGSEPELQLTTNGTVLRRGNLISPTFEEGGLYSYNGNKLDRIGLGNVSTYVKYIYTGNLITQYEYYEDNILKLTEYYTYDSNERLILRKGLSNTSNTGFKTVYTHNLDGTCSVQLFRGDLNNQNTLDDFYTRKVFFVNGRVDKIERYMMFGTNLETMTTAYTYDNKNNPYYIILGYSKLSFYEVASFNTPNNITSYTYSATNATIVDVDVNTYTYNSFNFPITFTAIDHFDDGQPDQVGQFLYDLP